MTKPVTRLVTIAALAALALTGCAATTGAQAVHPTPTASADSAVATHRPGTGATTTPSASGTPSADVFPAGQPPRPPVMGTPRWSDSVPGLTAAIRAQSHPGLQICGADIGSMIMASGDLRGNGGTQYLVDSTCVGATATSPEEVSVYETRGGALTRTAVVYEFTTNRPRPTAYPYMWQGHTVVLTYDMGAAYRLVRLTPDAVIPGLVQRFH